MGMRRYTQKRASRNLSLPGIAKLTDAQAYDLLRMIRFADTQGEPYCPYCWSKEQVRTQVSCRSDKRWLCKDCRKTFSLFSGTSWARPRNTLPKLLLMLGNFVTCSSGEPAIEIARKCDTDPTSTYYFLMKMREALHLEMLNEVFTGEVEVDGCWMGGFKRPMNDRRYEQKLKRAGLWKLPPKKVVCALRERDTGRTFVEIHSQEHEFIPTVVRKVEPGSIVYTDMAGSWEPLAKHFDLRSINHKERYWSKNASTQHVEALFHRQRRIEKNLVHVSGEYLDLYSAEIGFRQTYCRQSDAEKFLFLVGLALRSPVSRRFSGVWQRKPAR